MTIQSLPSLLSTPNERPIDSQPKLWYPLCMENEVSCQKPSEHQICLPNEKIMSLVSYRNQSRHVIIHSNVCPHMGAFFHQGWVSERGTLHCPYHGFEFDQGKFFQIPDPKDASDSWSSKLCKSHDFNHLSLVPTQTKGNMIWIPYTTSFLNSEPLSSLDTIDTKSSLIYLPPEAQNDEFRVIEGYVDMPASQMMVTENLLDMLHISYIHSFGNRMSPIPFSSKYQAISNTSGKTTFLYSPHTNTISTKIGKRNTVIVENEFHLPSITLTRVTAGNVIKTIWTATVPTSPTTCRLFWKMYRNFWYVPHFDVWNYLGDTLLRLLMMQTLKEDRWILERIHPLRDEWIKRPLWTPYDVTILKYRQALKSIQVQKEKKKSVL